MKHVIALKGMHCGARGAAWFLSFLFLATFAPRAFATTTYTVSSVPDLYAKVNDPANAGARIVLTAGTYPLDPGNSNNGRLELQENMELVGVDGDATKVIIDATGLQLSSYVLLPPELTTLTGPIRVGRGHNVVEWLTVQNDLNGAGLIETDLIPSATAPTVIRVAHVILKNGSRGIDFRLLGSKFNGKTVEATLEDNEVLNNRRGMAQGIRTTLSGVTGATVKVTLRNNLIQGNQAGLLASSQSSSSNSSNEIQITSTGDRFKDNRAGCWLIAGIGQTANFNSLTFTASGDEFTDNKRAPTNSAYPIGGGIVAAAGAGRGSDNIGRLEILFSTFSNSPNNDLSVYGYSDALLGTPVGLRNLQEFRITPSTQSLSIEQKDSDPEDLSSGNEVIQLPALLTALAPAQLWIGVRNSDDVGTKFDILVDVLLGERTIGSGQLNDVLGGGSGFNNARLNTINLTLLSAAEILPRDTLSLKVSARIAASSGHRSGTARLWFGDPLANQSSFGATIGGEPYAFFLTSSGTLETVPGTQRDFRDVTVNRTIANNAFVEFPMTWTERF